jgi:hypothetical protein
MAKLSLLDPTKTGRPAQDLESKLRRCIGGQEEAIHEVVRGYQTYAAGLCVAGRPIGNYLFLGPTGSGKTRIVEATAEALLNNPRAVTKIDCAEFQHSHEIAKLIGSPPAPNPNMRTLQRNIQRLKLDVAQHVPIHGQPGPGDQFAQIMGRQTN